MFLTVLMGMVGLTATAACFPVARWWWHDRRALSGKTTVYRKAAVAAAHEGRPSLAQTGVLPGLLFGLVLAAAGAWTALAVPNEWALLATVASVVGLCVVVGLLLNHYIDWGRRA